MDRQAAIVLGKALFWDMNAGSDETQACASCHFQRRRRLADQEPAESRPRATAGDDRLAVRLYRLGRPRWPELHGESRRLPVPSACRSGQPRLRDPVLERRRRRPRRACSTPGFIYTITGDEGTAPVDGLFHVGTRAARHQHAASGAAQRADDHQRRLQLPQLLGWPGQQRVQRQNPVRPSRSRRADLDHRCGSARCRRRGLR